jgi:hypothetical protein
MSYIPFSTCKAVTYIHVVCAAAAGAAGVRARCATTLARTYD